MYNDIDYSNKKEKRRRSAVMLTKNNRIDLALAMSLLKFVFNLSSFSNGENMKKHLTHCTSMIEIEKLIVEIVVLIIFLKHSYDFLLYSIH